MSKTIITALLLIGTLLAGLYLGKFYHASIPPVEKQVSGVKTDSAIQQKVVAQGRLLPFGGIYNVFAPQGQTVGKYFADANKTPFDRPGSKPKKGDVLVELVAHQLLEQQKQLANAKIEDADLELDQAVAVAKANVQRAELALRQAQLQQSEVLSQQDQSINEQKLQAAKDKLAKFKRLQNDAEIGKMISSQKIADQQLEIDEAQQKLDAGKKQLKLALDAANFAVSAAEKNLKSANEALTEAERLQTEKPRSLSVSKQLAETQYRTNQIRSPIDGVVLKSFVKTGESVVNSPLLQIGNLDKLECIAEVSERDIGMLRQHRDNVQVTIVSPALIDDSGKAIVLKGQISEIGRIVGDASLPVPNPLAMTDRKTVDVKIVIDEVGQATHFVNLQVEVEFVFMDKNARSGDSKDNNPQDKDSDSE